MTEGTHASSPFEPSPPSRAEGEPLGTTELSGAVFRELLNIVGRHSPLQSVLHDLAVLAVQTIPEADESSVTLVRDGRAWTIAFSGGLAPILDERQYEAEAGPCLHAAASGQTVSIDDTADDDSYPEFSRQASRYGVRHVLAVGIPTRQATNGAINLYGRGTAGAFSPHVRQLAADFADFAGIAMINAAVSQGALDEVLQMREAMASRAGIEQAKGILMMRHQCGQVQAFDMLRRQSMQTNQKLRLVAQALIDEVTLNAADVR